MNPSSNKSPESALGRWAWFIGLWIGGVVTVGCVSLALRWILLP